MFVNMGKVVLPLAVLFVGIGIFILLDTIKPIPEIAAELPRPLRVYTELVRQSSLQLRVDTQGEVRASIRSDIVNQVAGRIVEVSPEFIEGGRFAPNEMLLAVEDVDYHFAVDEAEARLASAKVELVQTLADADVTRKQMAGVKNPSPLSMKKPQVARAQAAFEAAEANLSLAKINLKRTRISLPYAGRVASTHVDLGQFISPGKLVAKVFGTDKVEIRLPITDSQLGALGVPIGFVAEEGRGLLVKFSATVAGQSHCWLGRVARLDAAIDPDTRVIYGTAEVSDPYDVDLANGQVPLAVGLFVDAVILGRTINSAMSIPSAGLRAGDRVFILSETGTLDIRNVRVIYRNSEKAVLASGVKAGEQVIVSAIRNPISGMRLEAISNRDDGHVSDDIVGDKCGKSLLGWPG